MVTFWGAPGLLVTLPLDAFLFIQEAARDSDAIVFWHGAPGEGDGTAWQPFLMPRRLYLSAS
jgi:hypothetical protein